MFEREDKIIAKEIIESFDKIFEEVKDIDYDNFKNDSVKIRSLLSEIELIGNNCQQITGEFRLTNEDVNWNYLIKTRARLSHTVLSPVNTDVLWTLIKNDYPEIRNNISKLF